MPATRGNEPAGSSSSSSPPAATSDRELIITREFDAPRRLVWEAWTDPLHVAQWWGPRGFTTRVDEIDLRVGGTWRYVMIAPNGGEYPVKGVFREVVPMQRIVMTDEFDEGFEHPSKADLPTGIVMTCTFEDVAGNRTRVTLHIEHRSAEDRRKHEEMGVVGGWNSSFECLDEHLAKIR